MDVAIEAVTCSPRPRVVKKLSQVPRGDITGRGFPGPSEPSLSRMTDLYDLGRPLGSNV